MPIFYLVLPDRILACIMHFGRGVRQLDVLPLGFEGSMTLLPLWSETSASLPLNNVHLTCMKFCTCMGSTSLSGSCTPTGMASVMVPLALRLTSRILQ